MGAVYSTQTQSDVQYLCLSNHKPLNVLYQVPVHFIVMVNKSGIAHYSHVVGGFID